MAEHLVQLWIRSDDDPSGIDWEAWLPKGVKVEHVQTRTFPWQDVQHEITWWITRRLTLDEWNDLDNAESEVLARIVGDEHFAGTAGPIPEIPNDHAEDVERDVSSLVPEEVEELHAPHEFGDVRTETVGREDDSSPDFLQAERRREMEREVDEEVAAGKVEVFDDAEPFLENLDELTSTETDRRDADEPGPDDAREADRAGDEE